MHTATPSRYARYYLARTLMGCAPAQIEGAA